MHLLPWKKAAKVTRISRIVADLQPPKRCGSLVVETGFPTSLIDLFVKNRDRLKRPSSVKKKSKRSRKRCDDDARRVDSVGAEFDPGRAESKGSELGVGELKAEEKPGNSNGSENRSPGKAEFVEMRRSTGTETAGEREEVEEEEEEDEEEEVAPDVFMAVVKVFAVAVLALSTKKLVVGITLSAFALLFLELVAKRLVPRFRRISERQSRKSESDSEEEEFVAPPRKQPPTETLHGIKFDEVCLRPELEQLSRDKKWGFLDEKDILLTDQAPAHDTSKIKNKSKRGQIRRKIIKTLRSVSKKKKLETKTGGDDEQAKSEEFEDAEETGDDFARLSLLSEEAAAEEGEEEEEEVVVVVVEEQIVEEEEEEEEEKEMKWLVVIIICGAVLLGLCWGRIFAVLLTIVWCLVMKLIGIIGTDQQKSSFTLTQPC